VLARGEFSINSRPCIAIGGASVQITASPWQAQLQVSFTSDPSSAGARISPWSMMSTARRTALHRQRGDPICGDLRKSAEVRADHLSLAGRPRRLSDFRAFEAF